MKTITLTTLAAISLVTSPVVALSNDEKTDTGKDNVALVILDDQTGPELEDKHGIVALDTTDLIPLTEAALIGKKTFLVGHIAIDEDARDNFIAKLTISPFEGPEPPSPVAPNLPFNKIAEAKREQTTKRNAWIRIVQAHNVKMNRGVEDFVRNVLVTQGNIARRFDEMLKERNGVDFNRSDIAGSVEAASKHLIESGAAMKILIMNSDAMDRPGPHRSIQVEPLTKDQLDPSVILIFVNRSFQPEREPIFHGLKNPVYHANTMTDAVRLVLEVATDKPSGD